jgi:glucose-1-phosphate adenylyltransferase
VYQNLDIIRNHNPDYILVLAGDHIYKMDYGAMVAHHVEMGADITVGCIEVDLELAKQFGVMSVDAENRVRSFLEKPDRPEPLPGHQDQALASMGIYVFNSGFLFEQLIKDADKPGSTHDFGKDMIPDVIARYRVMAYPFRDARSGGQAYWRDVGTVDAFWEANQELIGVTPPLNLYDETWPIWTYQEQLPPAKFVFDDDERRGMAVDSMVSGGCVISGARVRHSLLFSNVRVNSYAYVKDSVVLPSVDVGRNCEIRRSIIDRGCRLPEGLTLGLDPEADAAKGFYVSEGGVTLVTPEMLGQETNRVR